MTALLEVRDVEVWYADLQALFGVSIDVDAGEVVALIGANGASKSTLFRAIAGLLPLRSGEIRLDGARLGPLAAERIAQAGIA
jgi:branched-chain amino acid transport system ATP-binding protein